MCCEPSGYTKEEINGYVLIVGNQQLMGMLTKSVLIPPVVCKTCGYAPCDGSC